MTLIEKIIARAQSNRQRIVLPESLEARTLTAADRAVADKLAEIILIGNREEILARAKELNLTHIEGATIIDPKTSEKTNEYAALLYELRKAKGMTQQEAWKKVLDPLYFGCLIIKSGDKSAVHSVPLATPCDPPCRSSSVLLESLVSAVPCCSLPKRPNMAKTACW